MLVHVMKGRSVVLPTSYHGRFPPFHFTTLNLRRLTTYGGRVRSTLLHGSNVIFLGYPMENRPVTPLQFARSVFVGRVSVYAPYSVHTIYNQFRNGIGPRFFNVTSRNSRFFVNRVPIYPVVGLLKGYNLLRAIQHGGSVVYPHLFFRRLWTLSNFFFFGYASYTG